MKPGSKFAFLISAGIFLLLSPAGFGQGAAGSPSAAVKNYFASLKRGDVEALIASSRYIAPREGREDPKVRFREDFTRRKERIMRFADARPVGELIIADWAVVLVEVPDDGDKDYESVFLRNLGGKWQPPLSVPGDDFFDLGFDFFDFHYLFSADLRARCA